MQFMKCFLAARLINLLHAMDSSGDNMVENLLTSDDVASTSEGNIKNQGLEFLCWFSFFFLFCYGLFAV